MRGDRSRARCDQRLRRVCCAVPDSYVVTGFDEVRGHARRHGAKPKSRNFAHMTRKLARDSYACRCDCGAFQASPFDGDLAEMDAAGLVTEGVGQLIEGEAAVQDRAYPRLFERSDIILLLAPAADHKSFQARLLGQKIDGRHLALKPG